MSNASGRPTRPSPSWKFHEFWALRMGTSLEGRPRYTPTTTFETFPFPEGLIPADTAGPVEDVGWTSKAQSTSQPQPTEPGGWTALHLATLPLSMLSA